MKKNNFWTEFRERQEERREQFLADFEREKEKMDREYERDCNEVINAISGWLR